MDIRFPIRLVAGVALAASSSLAAVAAPGGIAGAAVKTVSCAGFRTDASATHIFLSRCTGSGHHLTGATGTQSILSSGTPVQGEVTWKTGKTSLLTYTITSLPNDCPKRTGYTKFIKVSYSGKVTGGTAMGMVGGPYSGTVCGYQVIPSGGLAGFPVGPQNY
jgi:hypothetical protein